jgi:hypothetical protein
VTTVIRAIPHIAAAQNQKEVTANDAFDRLDEAITGRLRLDFTSGDITLAASQFRRHVAFAAIDVVSGRELILPAIRRVIVVDNTAGAADLIVRQGATTVTVPAGAGQLLHTTGTTEGLVAVAPTAQTGGAAPFDIALYFPGQPEAAERLLELEAARGFTLPADLAGSRGHADTAATAEAVSTLLQNGAAVGSITFAAASQDAAFAPTGGLALVPGDRLELVAPATQDATLAGLALTLTLTFAGNTKGAPTGDITRVQLRSMNQSSSNRFDVWLDHIVIADDLGGQNDDFLGDLRISAPCGAHTAQLPINSFSPAAKPAPRKWDRTSARHIVRCHRKCSGESWCRASFRTEYGSTSPSKGRASRSSWCTGSPPMLPPPGRRWAGWQR